MQLKINLCNKTKCHPNWSWDTSHIPWFDYDFWLVLDGIGTLETPDKKYSVSRGDCFNLEGGKRYIGRHDPLNPLTVIYVHYDYLGIDSLPIRPYGQAIGEYRYIGDMDFIENIANRLLLARENNQNNVMHDWMKALFNELKYRGLNENDKHRYSSDLVIQDIKQKIIDTPSHHFRIKELSSLYNYSPDHLSKLFKSSEGVTLEKYLIRFRVNQGMILLRETSLTISEISQQLGYNDIYHFSKQFKAVTGLTPTAYKKSIT